MDSTQDYLALQIDTYDFIVITFETTNYMGNYRVTSPTTTQCYLEYEHVKYSYMLDSSIITIKTTETKMQQIATMATDTKIIHR